MTNFTKLGPALETAYKEAVVALDNALDHGPDKYAVAAARALVRDLDSARRNYNTLSGRNA